MMKQKWVRPQAMVQTFTPNEYVAACWGVGCSITPSNTYEETHYSGRSTWAALGCSHASDHCGTNSNQVIKDDNNDGIADRMVEVGTDGLGTLTCTIYTDANYSTTRDVSSVKVNDYIYWTTVSGNRTWHHQGTVYATATGHPNRS